MLLLLLGSLALADLPTLPDPSAGAPISRDLPAGAPVPEALAVQVGPSALDVMAEQVADFLPPSPYVVDHMGQSTGAWCFSYSYDVWDLSVDYELLDTRLVPVSGRLLVEADLMVAVNTEAQPFSLQLDAICTIDEDCTGWIDSFPLTVRVPVTLGVSGSPGSRVLDAQVGEVEVDHTLTLDDVSTDCNLGSIESVLNAFGMSMFDLVIGALADQVTAEVQGMLETLGDAASFAQLLEVQGAVVDARVEPASATVHPEGLELVWSARLDAQPDPCVAAFDPALFTTTGGPVPLAEPGVPMALHAAGDLMNQAAYTFWRAGLLCQELGGDGVALGPVALDTSLLGLLGGEAYEALFPEAGPLWIRTWPHTAPEVDLGGPHDLDVGVRDLELVFLAELDGRMARAVGVSLDADVGVDLVFDEATGRLEALVDLTPEDVTLSLVGPLLAEGIEDQVLGTVTSVVRSMMGSLVDGLLGDALAVDLPTFEGLGLTGLEVTTTGAEGDWVGAFGALGPVDYAAPGGGCEGGDCGGCATSGPGGAGWLVGLLLLAARRRRR